MPDAPGAGAAVALRKESVDRNDDKLDTIIESIQVALRKESVDRNSFTHSLSLGDSVALRKESVDRNSNSINYLCEVFCRSPQGERG